MEHMGVDKNFCQARFTAEQGLELIDKFTLKLTEQLVA